MVGDFWCFCFGCFLLGLRVYYVFFEGSRTSGFRPACWECRVQDCKLKVL